MPDIQSALEWARAHKDEHLNELIEVLAIPSVSTLPEHKPDIERCANYLADHLRGLGLTTVELKQTPGHPIVYGEWLEAPGKPTVLVYGHYDVQPADPFDEWDSPPFEPTVREDYIYARGASDMKGQIFGQIKAMQALSKHGGGIPFNVKYLIEGEEEIGSENLEAFIDANLDLLKCDFVLNTDAGIYGMNQPGITYSLRGLAYFEVELRGPSKDLHSGRFGGTVRNPANELCQLIAGLHDADGRVTLPGFYDNVRDLPQEERDAIAQLPYSDEGWKEMSCSKALYGEKGFTTHERVGVRPCLDVNGIWSGFTGEGAKTVLPAVATAKISTRLVANQKHTDIPAMLNAYMEANVPEGMDWTVRDLGGGPASSMDRHSPYMKAAEDALRTTFGKETLFSPEGGSIPVVGMMQEKLGSDSIMLGFALPDDGIHGPNERQYVPNFFIGIETYIHYMTQIGA